MGQYILVNIIGTNRVNVRLIPQVLIFWSKRSRIEVAKKMLDNVAGDPTVIKRISTGDATWAYEYVFETVQQSTEWRSFINFVPTWL